MARTNWFDDTSAHPTLHERVEKLDSFTQAMADGRVDRDELQAQEARLTAAMKAVRAGVRDTKADAFDAPSTVTA